MRANLKAKRMLSKLLCLAMVLGLVPTLALPALAAEEQAGTDNGTYEFRLDAITVTKNANGAIKNENGPITIQTADSTVTGEVTLNLSYKIGSGWEPVTDGAYKLTEDSFVFDPALPNNASPVTKVEGPAGESGTITVTLSVLRAYTDRNFDVTAKIMDRDGKDTSKTANVGKIEIKAYYPTPINLTGIENAVGTVTDGKLTVTSSKACVVLWSATDTSTTAAGVKDSTASDWKRLSGTAGQNNTYTFDLSKCTNVKAVVVALKGDYSFDGTINASDFGPLVLVSKQLDTITSLKMAVCDLNGDSTINASDFAPLVLVSKQLDNLAWDLNNGG